MACLRNGKILIFLKFPTLRNPKYFIREKNIFRFILFHRSDKIRTVSGYYYRLTIKSEPATGWVCFFKSRVNNIEPGGTMMFHTPFYNAKPITHGKRTSVSVQILRIGRFLMVLTILGFLIGLSPSPALAESSWRSNAIDPGLPGPGQPTLVSPSGYLGTTYTPTFVWNVVDDAEVYLVQIIRPGILEFAQTYETENVCGEST